jgi:hypothetical protein
MPWKRWAYTTLIGVPLVLIAGVALWTWGSLRYCYARGERAGYIQKFSQKGWICKTWEGDLAMVTLPGTAPDIFSFSVRDPAIAKKITPLVGQRVSLKYEQHKGVPTACFGETEYFIVDAGPVSSPPVP